MTAPAGKVPASARAPVAVMDPDAVMDPVAETDPGALSVPGAEKVPAVVPEAPPAAAMATGSRRRVTAMAGAVARAFDAIASLRSPPLTATPCSPPSGPSSSRSPNSSFEAGSPPCARRSPIRNSRTGNPGGTAVNADAVLNIAEQLLPAVNLAAWKDRATAAQSAGKELRLRDLRAVVAASRAVTLDDEGRTFAKALQDTLNHRVTALRDEWVTRLTGALDEGRILEAVRTSSRPPEPATRLPADLAVRVAELASAAMTAETPEETWLGLLEAVVESPVRRTVKPLGIPASPQAQEAARHAAGLVPELAKLLGLRIPPPPPRRLPPRRPPLMAAGGAGPATSL